MVNIHEPGPPEGGFEQWPVLSTSAELEVRLAETEEEVEQAQRLRYRVFYEEMSATPSPEMRAERRDFDRFDPVCDHLLVVDRAVVDEDGQPSVVGTYRLMRDEDASRAGGFYSATEYDLTPMLRGLPAGTRHLELGRSCILKDYRTKPGTTGLPLLPELHDLLVTAPDEVPPHQDLLGERLAAEQDHPGALRPDGQVDRRSALVAAAEVGVRQGLSVPLDRAAVDQDAVFEPRVDRQLQLRAGREVELRPEQRGVSVHRRARQARQVTEEHAGRSGVAG